LFIWSQKKVLSLEHQRPRNVFQQKLLPLTAALSTFCLSAYAAPQRNVPAGQVLSLKADCGVLSVTPIAEGALRVRCAPSLSEDTNPLVLIHPSKNVPSTVWKNAASASISTSRMTATYARKTGVLRFTDAKGQLLLELRGQISTLTKGGFAKT
jgi:hypothetical protein